MNTVLEQVRNFDKAVEKNFRSERISFPSELDLFFKWLPVIYVLMADAAGIKTKNRFIQRVIIISLSELIVNGFVKSFKKLVQRRRPDSFFKFDSFPSGHTATSFSGAEILHEEIKGYRPVLSLTGYTIAMTTAALRLYKRKHWLSDIVAGAIVGIVSAKVSYLLYPQK